MSEQDEDKIEEYVLGFNPPAEIAFLSKEIETRLKEQRAKLENTAQLVPTILAYDDFEERLQRAVVEGRIYNPSQYQDVQAKMTALNEGDGERVDIQESLVSPTGQRIIMSGRLQEVLNFLTDGYIPQDQVDELVSALQSDNVPSPEIDKVRAAMNKYGAIVVQRGVFSALKGELEDSIGHKLALYVPGSTPILPQMISETPANKPLPVPAVPKSTQTQSQSKPKAHKPLSSYTQDELPFGFIEYLKNTDKNFDRVESDLLRDQSFLEFFHLLQQSNKFYKTMPVERMAHEVIIRPPLWIKLSNDVQHAVAEMVERHRPDFSAKIKEIATTAGASKLDELMNSLK